MKQININPVDLSLIFWKKILDNSLMKQHTYQKSFFAKIDSLDDLRDQSTFNTGSVSSTTAWILFSLCLFFKPKNILEVGSFIGKSTFSMALAADTYLKEKKSEIFCCDLSNKIIFPNLTTTKIHQFHKTTSTDMLKQIEDEKIFDLIHLDGKLNPKDFDLLKNKISQNTLFAFDDFDGNNKGVINYHLLLDSNVISKKTHCVVYPVQKEISNSFNLLEPSTTAVVLPFNLLTF